MYFCKILISVLSEDFTAASDNIQSVGMVNGRKNYTMFEVIAGELNRLSPLLALRVVTQELLCAIIITNVCKTL